MAGTGTFLIFVSSTFDDLRAERNALQRYVFPRLRKLCASKGASLQEIDLRWGVSEEASLDQRTMPICLGEIKRCLETTPKPNFVALLRDRSVLVWKLLGRDPNIQRALVGLRRAT